MKKIHKILISLLAVIVILTPIFAVFGIVLFTPPVYSNTFYGALDEKYERLTTIEEDKIIVVGGSSVAFGIDSILMEEKLGRPVVNFGLYAAIGTKAMLDLSRAGVKEGDIVVLAPELDAQTLSMYFSSKNFIMSLDDDYSMLRYVRGDNKLSLLGASWEHAVNKLTYLREGIPDPAGIYNIKSFNEYWDIDMGLRQENIMPLYYDPTTVISLEPGILADDFAEYINEYIDFCESKGATVYFSFAPLNELAVEDASSETLTAFTDSLKSRINCEFISILDDYIMEPGYFYDTNYHLNDAGVVKRTAQLIGDLALYMGLGSANIPVPPAPALPVRDVAYNGYDPNEIYFTYEALPSGALMITGLTEEGREQRELTVPLGADGVKITHIGEGAFTGSSVTRVNVPENTYLRQFLDGAFKDSSVYELWIYYDFGANENEKLAPSSNFYGLTIHFPPNSAYLMHYDWNESSSGFTRVFDAVK